MTKHEVSGLLASMIDGIFDDAKDVFVSAYAQGNTLYVHTENAETGEHDYFSAVIVEVQQ